MFKISLHLDIFQVISMVTSEVHFAMYGLATLFHLLCLGQLVAAERVVRFHALVMVEVSKNGGSGGHDCNNHMGFGPGDCLYFLFVCLL